MVPAGGVRGIPPGLLDRFNATSSRNVPSTGEAPCRWGAALSAFSIRTARRGRRRWSQVWSTSSLRGDLRDVRGW